MRESFVVNGVWEESTYIADTWTDKKEEKEVYTELGLESYATETVGDRDGGVCLQVFDVKDTNKPYKHMLEYCDGNKFDHIFTATHKDMLDVKAKLLDLIKQELEGAATNISIHSGWLSIAGKTKYFTEAYQEGKWLYYNSDGYRCLAPIESIQHIDVQEWVYGEIEAARNQRLQRVRNENSQQISNPVPKV